MALPSLSGRVTRVLTGAWPRARAIATCARTGCVAVVGMCINADSRYQNEQRSRQPTSLVLFKSTGKRSGCSSSCSDTCCRAYKLLDQMPCRPMGRLPCVRAAPAQPTNICWLAPWTARQRRAHVFLA
uniref:Uncharacterized protein n=1 Tax=Setaria viridis TaxID=4556 RepID=A0A4U6UI43_SETVI|nr:hypothetical protein SEVIR_5G207866v2 [Setaria viridis]